ncbi:MAG TPA: hypothetical protein VJ739_06375 [Gemmataceae bacterium]|nr:hypothetical protein [Gemmataceae bacterium]
MWVALLVTAAAAFSLGFACAMPFAALCAVAACTLPRRDAYYLAGAVWGANQVIGFAVLHYPWAVHCLAWGAALALAVLLCTAAARWARGRLTRLRPLTACAVAFPAAFVVFEGVLLAISLPLGGVEDFAPSVVAWVFAVNAVALVGLFALNGAAALLGIANPSLPRYRRTRKSASSAAASMARMSP